MTTQRPWSSVAFRLAISYSALVLLTMAVVLSVFYVQTVGVLRARIDRQIEINMDRLEEQGERYGREALVQQIIHILRDGKNSDTEILMLVDEDGNRVVGNIAQLRINAADFRQVKEVSVMREGRPALGRMSVHTLSDGSNLWVGSEMQPQREIEYLFGRASLTAMCITLLMAVGGAWVFRRVVDERAGDIRRTMSRVASGDLGQRIPVMARDDEFTLLNRDINAMLDRVEQLMEGVRHVSNTIAHNLRTPLTRVLLQLRTAQRGSPDEQAAAIEFAVQEMAELGVVFDKLLNIAEVETGARRQDFGPVDLHALVTDVVEFYEPLAQDRGCALTMDLVGEPVALGDGDLLASALANVIDNALKYTQDDGSARIHVRAQVCEQGVELSVRDNGAGVPDADLSHITTRFYRAASSQPGYGLGLASVQAIVQLHGGTLEFFNVHPGLEVRMVLPQPLV